MKNVKKKKRSSNIGAGRQDDDEQENDIEPPMPPVLNQGINQIKETIYEETTRDSLSELPPPPLPPMNSILSSVDIKPQNELTSLTVPVDISIGQVNNGNISTTSTLPVNELEVIPVLKRSYSGLNDTSPREEETQISYTPKIETLSDNKGWENTQKIAEDDYANFDATIRNLCVVKDNSLKELRELHGEMEKEEQQLRNLLLKLSEQEKEQHKLAEQEEFEKADALSSAIEKLRGDIERLQQNVEKLSENATKADKKVEQASNAHNAAVIKIFNNLQEFSKKILLEKSRIQEDSKEKHEREDSRLKAEEERISLEQKHVEKAEEVLEEELRTTEDAIQSQSGDAVAQETDMAEKLTLVAMEIDALEAQLASKREEEKKLKVEMNAIQSKVFEVRKKYDRQLKNIKERKEVIEINKYECQKEKSLLDNERASLDKDIQRVSTLIEEMDMHEKSVSFDMQIIEILQQIQNHSVISERAPAMNEEFKLALTEASMAISDAINQQTALTKKVELLGLENKDIDDRIPKLESEKKAHAAAKRFKEAASVAKDIQALKSKQEENSKEIDEITAEIPKHADTIFALRQKEVEAKANLLAAQKDEDIIRFNKLQKRIKEFQVTRRKIMSMNNFAKLKECSLYSIDTALNGVLAEANIIKEEHNIAESLEDDGLDEEIVVVFEPVENLDSNNDNTGIENVDVDVDEVVCIEATSETSNEEIAVVLVESADSAESDEQSTSELEENNQALEQAKYLLQVIASTEKLLTEASDAENYEDAAVYQDKLEEMTQLLQTQLIELRLTEDDLRKMI